MFHYPPLHYVASPATNYKNTPVRHCYVVFPTPDSSRAVNLSFSIRPGALEESYSAEWLASNPGDGVTTLEDSAHYDLLVKITPSSQYQYQCRVSIQHRSDQEVLERHDGPEIIIEKKGEVVILLLQCIYYMVSFPDPHVCPPGWEYVS